MSEKIIQLNENVIKDELNELVRKSVFNVSSTLFRTSSFKVVSRVFRTFV